MPLEEEAPLFDPPVECALPGSNVRVIMGNLERSGPPVLGTTVHGREAVALGEAALPDWKPLGPADVGDDAVVGDSGVVKDLVVARRRASRPPRPRSPTLATPIDGLPPPDDSGGDEDVDADRDLSRGTAAPSAAVCGHLPPRPRRSPATTGSIKVALASCLRRACGLPSQTAVGKDPSSVTATVVEDPGSRSRAIALRFGSSKLDAILWVSSQGGVLCSCFSGTQNALFLTVSSRSSDCRHTAMLRKCVGLAGASVAKLVARMRLADGAADFAARSRYGNSTVWTVLYQSVFSLVTFTAGNVATCIAPGCRRFRGRCGHVRVARPSNAELR